MTEEISQDPNFPTRKLWIGNITNAVTEQLLRNEFLPFGQLEDVKVVPNRYCGFVTFSEIRDAVQARNVLQGKFLIDRNIKINFIKQDPNAIALPSPMSAPVVTATPSYMAVPPPYVNFQHPVPTITPTAVNMPPFLTGMSASTVISPGISAPIAGIPPPWQAPIPTPPPSNPEEQKVIDKLAEFVVKNGPNFEEQVKTKEKGNSKLEFLFGGDGYSYYQWKKYCLLNNIPAVPFSTGSPLYLGTGQNSSNMTPPLSFPNPLQMNSSSTHTVHNVCSSNQSPPSIPQENSTSLQSPSTFNESDSRELEMLLSTLNGTKDSIKNAKDWIIKNISHSSTIVFSLFQQVMNEKMDTTRKLHVLYLVNDVLYHSLKMRPESGQLDQFSEAILPYLPPMMHCVCHAPISDQVMPSDDSTNEIVEKISKILFLWSQRKIYDEKILKQIESLAKSAQPPPISHLPSFRTEPLSLLLLSSSQPPLLPPPQSQPQQKPLLSQPQQQLPQQQQQQPLPSLNARHSVQISLPIQQPSISFQTISSSTQEPSISTVSVSSSTSLSLENATGSSLLRQSSAPQISTKQSPLQTPSGNSTTGPLFEQIIDYFKSNPAHPAYTPINTIFLKPSIVSGLSSATQDSRVLQSFEEFRRKISELEEEQERENRKNIHLDLNGEKKRNLSSLSQSATSIASNRQEIRLSDSHDHSLSSAESPHFSSAIDSSSGNSNSNSNSNITKHADTASGADNGRSHSSSNSKRRRRSSRSISPRRSPRSYSRSSSGSPSRSRSRSRSSSRSRSRSPRRRNRSVHSKRRSRSRSRSNSNSSARSTRKRRSRSRDRSGSSNLSSSRRVHRDSKRKGPGSKETIEDLASEFDFYSGTRRDGSSAFSSGERLGLGANPYENQDLFESFRQQRSAGYHSRIENRFKTGSSAEISSGLKCYRCGRNGHLARECTA